LYLPRYTANLLTLLLIQMAGLAHAEPGRSPDISPQNVILIIGDGMDDHQITIARNYLKGVRGRLVLDNMPVRGSVQVLTIDETDPAQPRFVADSANSATAMATGKVTSRGRIATSAREDKDIRTIVELAQQSGLKTGLVTTSSVTDATPASFVTHIKLRHCENPDVMVSEKFGMKFDCASDQKRNGGAGSISEQLAASGLNVLLGGGLKHFAVNAEDSNESVESLAHSTGFELVHTKQALNEASADSRLLGLFADSHLPVRLRGESGRIAEKPVLVKTGEVNRPPPMACEDNPAYKDTPPLVLMTQKALEILDHDNDRGFFLMIESASIDKQSHYRNPCGSIGELAQLDETLAEVLEFTRIHPETLVVVTADHGQAAQLVPSESLFSGLPVFTPGAIARIRMPQGGLMGVNYATNDFVAQEHTGVVVPLYTNDNGKSLFPAYLTQPEIFDAIRSYLGL
jgi:alkaline phosphatase